MAKSLFHSLRRTFHLYNLVLPRSFSHSSEASIFHPLKLIVPRNQTNPFWVSRQFSHGTVNLVISEGKPKFETRPFDPAKKEKWINKKRFKLQKKREKDKRKAANKKDPRHLGLTRKPKKRFANAEERIKYKLDKAKIKEALLVERLKRYEVPKLQGPVVKPHDLTGEERFYMKKMAQKRSNYVPVGRRGIFGGLILNMHMHWKKHETVKVICNTCKPGQAQEYADEIARLSGGIPVQIIGDDTIVFYRGKNYVQPEVMSPVDTLSKKKALEKSKYEQSLESVRRFIDIAEKELELYYRHVALYGDPNNRNPISVLDSPTKNTRENKETRMLERDGRDYVPTEFSSNISDREDSEFELSDFDEGSSPELHESDDEDSSVSDHNSCSEDNVSYCDGDGEESSSRGISYTKLNSLNVSQIYDSKELNS